MINWKKLSSLNKNEIKELQNKRLRYFIRHKIPFHPFYSRLFKKNNIKVYDINNIEDLKKMPFTSKADIAPRKKEPKKHIDFVLQPDKESIKKYSSKKDLFNYFFNKKNVFNEFKPIHVHFTTGRTANAVPILYTTYCLERLKEAGRRMMDVFNIKGNETLINGFPYAPHLAFWQVAYAVNAINLMALHTGGGKILGSERIIKAIESMNATVLAFMPGYAYHLLREAKEKNANFSSVKHVIFGGERVPEGLREKIRELLGSMKARNVKVLATYAFTEGKVAWPQCDEKSGYHLYPDMEFIEVIDNNGENVAEGEKGEIGYTSLDFRGTVFLRYKTGDIGRIYYDKCGCGRNVPRISADIERKSEFKEFNLTKVKGSLVNLNIFFDIMMGHKAIDEWQVEIKKKNNDPYEIDVLTLYVATKREIDFNKLKKELNQEIFDSMGITPEIVKMELKKLLEILGMETELKEKRIVDKRP